MFTWFGPLILFSGHRESSLEVWLSQIHRDEILFSISESKYYNDPNEWLSAPYTQNMYQSRPPLTGDNISDLYSMKWWHDMATRTKPGQSSTMLFYYTLEVSITNWYDSNYTKYKWLL